MVPLDPGVATLEKILVQFIASGDDRFDPRVGIGSDTGDRVRSRIHMGEDVNHVSADHSIRMTLGRGREVGEGSQTKIRSVRRREDLYSDRIRHAIHRS